MSDRIGFGIVGCGVIGPTHAEAIKQSPDLAELVACFDTDAERADKFSAENGGIAAYTSLDEFLAHPGLGAICVCTPSGTHAAVVTAAAKRGIHSLVEKPLDITPEGLDAIARAAKEHNVKVGGVFQRRTLESVIKTKEALDSGSLGKPVLGQAVMKWHRSQGYYDSGNWRGTWKLDGGGALMNQGIHVIDALIFIMGEVESVKANIGTLTHNIEVEDTATAVIRFKSGALGTVVGTTSMIRDEPVMVDVHGEKGSITLLDDNVAKWYIEGQDAPETGGSSPSAEPSIKPISGHPALLRDMCEAIRDDRPPMVPPEEARRAVDLILAIYRSAKENREVVL